MKINGQIEVVPGSRDHEALMLASESNHITPEGTERPDFNVNISPDEVTALRLMVAKYRDPQNTKTYGGCLPWHMFANVQITREMAEHGLIVGTGDRYSDLYHITLFGRFVHALLDGNTCLHIRLPRVEGEWE